MEIKRYLVPKSLDEAMLVLNQSPDNHVFAGGAWIKSTLKQVDTAIELSNLISADIIDHQNKVEIGAMCTLHELEKNPILNQLYGGIVSKASQSIMGITVKNIATIGGTIAGKYSFSDLLTALLAIDVTLVFHQKGKIKISEYLNATYLTKDILLKIEIEKSKGVGYFHKVARTSLDFAIINVAIVKDRSHYKIVVGSRPGTAVCAIQAMDYLNGLTKVSSEDIEKASQIALSELSFSSNFRGNAEYRKTLAQVYIKRGLKEVSTHVN